MATSKPRPDAALESWEAKAAFMRRHNAVHATWDTVGDLLSLQVAPAQEPQPARPPGPARRMAEHLEAAAAKRRHDTLFAACSVRPKFEKPEPAPSRVPRAVRAKQEAAEGGEASDE